MGYQNFWPFSSANNNDEGGLTEQRLKEIFGTLDVNKDGRLSKEELGKAFKDLGSYFPSLRAHGALRCADGDNDGFININEMQNLIKYAAKQGYTIK